MFESFRGRIIMREVSVEIRVVLYREHDLWVAHCLEFDVIGSGETKDEAFRMLAEAIAIQIEHSIQHDNPGNLFRPADSETFQRFAMGVKFDCNSYAVKLHFANFDISGCSAREYHEEDLQLA